MAKVLDCEFVIADKWTILSGSATGFGDGTDYIEVSRTGSDVGLRVSVTGDASLIDRVEFDSTVVPDVGNYGYYDSNNEWVNLSDTDTLSYDASGPTCHIIYSFDSYPTTIDRLWVSLKSTQATLSNFRVYDANGNILNMETSPSDDDDDTDTDTDTDTDVDTDTDTDDDPPATSFSAKIGTSAISKCYLGNTEIVKVYMGRNVLYEKSDSSSTGNASFEGNPELGGWD